MQQLLAFLIGWALAAALLIAQAKAEEHDHAQLGAAGEFYSKWQRPKGNFTGIGHRTQSCCNRTDCDVVTGVSIIKGKMWITVRREPSRWYPVDPAIIEANQEDPRESPDGMSHACIIGGTVACFVEGSGI